MDGKSTSSALGNLSVQLLGVKCLSSQNSSPLFQGSSAMHFASGWYCWLASQGWKATLAYWGEKDCHVTRRQVGHKVPTFTEFCSNHDEYEQHGKSHSFPGQITWHYLLQQEASFQELHADLLPYHHPRCNEGVRSSISTHFLLSWSIGQGSLQSKTSRKKIYVQQPVH